MKKLFLLFVLAASAMVTIQAQSGGCASFGNCNIGDQYVQAFSTGPPNCNPDSACDGVVPGCPGESCANSYDLWYFDEPCGYATCEGCVGCAWYDGGHHNFKQYTLTPKQRLMARLRRRHYMLLARAGGGR